MAKSFLTQIVSLFAKRKAKQRTSPQAGNSREPGDRSYPVGIVGESAHQTAIRRCEIGERVQVVKEVGNPHDSDAIAVVRLSGARIGYIGRDSWLYGAINEQGKGCTAHIKAIQGSPLGVVIDVEMSNRELGLRQYSV